MSNNKLCDLIGGAGCLIMGASCVLMFFGANCLLGALIGIGMMLLSLYEYEN